MNKPIRVRFAPSPTGPLHIGGVRTALYNYLFARRNKGQFILRIEDTDQLRYVKGAEQYIIESLKWLGIDYDEGPDKGGTFSPYKQSERKELYRQFADKLLADGHAYYAFDTAAELDQVRKEFEQKGESFKYDSKTRLNMRNSITLSQDEVNKLLASGKEHVIRIKIPENMEIEVDDLIRGKVGFKSVEMDDKVLFKSDGLPTYHLANVVDDHVMEITHVIRGEEWLPSAPLHVLLYDFLGWKENMPAFAHIPLIMKSTGKGKLSKRDGDTGGFPVFPLEWTDPESGEMYKGYRESGYFPEAVINIIVLLGWNPGTEKELYSLQELINDFSLDRVGKSGARFDPEKAKWFNHQYLQMKSEPELLPCFKHALNENKNKYDDGTLLKIISLIKERAYFPDDLLKQSFYFFYAPDEYEQQMLNRKWKEDSGKLISEIKKLLSELDIFNADAIEKTIKFHIEKNSLNFGEIMSPLRLCLVGSGQGVHLFDIMEIIGKNETISRIEKALNKIGLSEKQG